MDKNTKKWASNAEFGYDFPTINGENFTKPELKFIFKNMYISKRHTKNQGILFKKQGNKLALLMFFKTITLLKTFGGFVVSFGEKNVKNCHFYRFLAKNGEILDKIWTPQHFQDSKYEISIK